MINDITTAKSLIGSKVIQIPSDELFNALSKKVLFEARWGFTKGNLTDEEYNKIINNKAIPALEKLIAQEKQTQLIECKAVYGFFPVISKGNKIIVFSESTQINEKAYLAYISKADSKTITFDFPRQTKEPNLCISDFVNNKKLDLIAFFAVTIGSKIIEEEKKLFESNSYYDYHLLHGLGAELADCGAVCIHNHIYQEIIQKCAYNDSQLKSTRYSFGYLSCPELSYQEKLFELLKPDRIGLSLTQNYQMVPELSVSGFIIFNDKARYFIP